jgi:hypothetical protein
LFLDDLVGKVFVVAGLLHLLALLFTIQLKKILMIIFVFCKPFTNSS